MKKVLFVLCVCLTLSQANLVRELKLGIGQIEAKGSTSTSYTAAFSATHYSENDFLFGIAVNLSKGDLTLIDKKENMYSFSTDIKAGYALFAQRISLYALASAISNSTKSQESYGFGYGAGVGYRLFDNFSLSAEYKTHRLSSDKVEDYDYETLNGFISFVF